LDYCTTEVIYQTMFPILRGWRSQGVRVQIPPTASLFKKLKKRVVTRFFYCRYIVDKKFCWKYTDKIRRVGGIWAASEFG
jgi:hypothetical protein